MEHCLPIIFRPTPQWALHSWRCLILRGFGAQIGEGRRINPTASVWAPWNLVMGDYVAIAEGVDLYNVAPIHIGSKVAVSQNTFLCTASHDITSLSRPLVHTPISIANHAWIAAGVMLHPGVVVEEGVVVAARAVLRGRAQAWSIWAGNPARQVGERKIAC